MTNDLQFMSLWAINDELEVNKACKQLEILQKRGIEGVIFHPRNYPNKPEYLSKEYFDLVSKIILYAKELGLAFWIYDENGWPSGTANGKVIQQNPELRKYHVELHEKARKDSGGQILSNVIHGKKDYSFVKVSREEASTIDGKATNKFIEIVYEGYKKNLKKEAFDYVTGFFSDEVTLPVHPAKNVPSIPWVEDMAEIYDDKYHRDIVADLPAIFLGEDSKDQIRIDFWELCAELLGERFYGQINTWCLDNGKRYTAHLKAEENMAFAIPFNGNAFTVLKNVDMPAIDALERKPSNTYYPRIASSLSNQFGDGRSHCEILGGSGWGLNPADVKRYIEWLSDCGINTFCFHLAQYTSNASSITDWPPNIPEGLSWKNGFVEILADLRSLNLQRKVNQKKYLLIAPVRSVLSKYVPWELTETNRHNASAQPDTESTQISRSFNDCVDRLSKAGVQFEVIDEKLFEQYGEIKGDGYTVGKSSYDALIISRHCRFEKGNRLEELAFCYLEDFVSELTDEVSDECSKEDSGELSIFEKKLLPHDKNLIPFTEKFFLRDSYCYSFICKGVPSQLKLITSNEVKHIEVNQNVLVNHFTKRDEITGQYCVELPVDYLNKGSNTITVLPKDSEAIFCWLEGLFIVTIEEGTIILEDFDSIKASLLPSFGAPFMKEPIRLMGKTKLADDFEGSLVFKEFAVDMIKARFDEGETRLAWNGEMEIEKINLSKGLHEVYLELYPSTYNAMGPNYYIYGDANCITPMQYKGIKNFADPIDAPADTQGNELHYKLLEMGRIKMRKGGKEC